MNKRSLTALARGLGLGSAGLAPARAQLDAFAKALGDPVSPMEESFLERAKRFFSSGRDGGAALAMSAEAVLL